MAPAGLVDAREHPWGARVPVVVVVLPRSCVAVLLADPAIGLAALHPQEILAVARSESLVLEFSHHRGEAARTGGADGDGDDAQLTVRVGCETDCARAAGLRCALLEHSLDVLRVLPEERQIRRQVVRRAGDMGVEGLDGVRDVSAAG